MIISHHFIKETQGCTQIMTLESSFIFKSFTAYSGIRVYHVGTVTIWHGSSSSYENLSTLSILLSKRIRPEFALWFVAASEDTCKPVP